MIFSRPRLFIAVVTMMLIASVFNMGHARQLRQSPPKSIRQLLGECDSLKVKGQFDQLQQKAKEGLDMVAANDMTNRAMLLFDLAISYYYRVKFDSAQYYFYQSLFYAQKTDSAKLITNVCVALIPVDYQLRQQDKADSCKNILQSITDTAKDKDILQNGYYALGYYYQQKAYYTTAQDYYLKGIELRRKEADTTRDVKKKLDYAIQCYTLFKLYMAADMPSNAFDILKDGRRFMNLSPVVNTRYLSSLTEAFSGKAGNIDSALFFLHKLNEVTKNVRPVPSEAVDGNIYVAQYYLDKKQYDKAFPFISHADSLASISQSPLLIYQGQLIKGRYYQETGNPQQAIVYLSKSIPLAKQLSKEEYADDLKYMALAQAGIGDEKASLQYYRQYVQLLDSITKEKMSRNFADQETRYQTNRKAEQIIILNKENQLKEMALANSSRLKWILITGLIVMAIFSLLMYLFYRNKEKLNKLLNDRNEALDKLNIALAQANDTKAKLFGIISHDLRSPVSNIVQLLRLKKENPGLVASIDQGDREEKLNIALVNVLDSMEDLLVWSKSQMEHFSPEIHTVNVDEVIIREIQFLDPLIRQQDVHIHYTPEKFYRQTDENFVSIIIRNLLQNAVKNSVKGSSIEIYTSQECLYITNTSLLVNAGELNRKLHALHTDGKKTGLGLQIIQDLSKAIHVEISFKQEDNNRITAAVQW